MDQGSGLSLAGAMKRGMVVAQYLSGRHSRAVVRTAVSFGDSVGEGSASKLSQIAVGRP